MEPQPAVKHFRNFLGPHASSLCGVMQVPEDGLTLDPARVTCERCLARLGLLRKANIGLPPGKKRDG